MDLQFEKKPCLFKQKCLLYMYMYFVVNVLDTLMTETTAPLTQHSLSEDGETDHSERYFNTPWTLYYTCTCMSTGHYPSPFILAGKGKIPCLCSVIVYLYIFITLAWDY